MLPADHPSTPTPRADRRHRDVAGRRPRPPPPPPGRRPRPRRHHRRGPLLLAARDAGARRIVIGCGGSATTDGGLGRRARRRVGRRPLHGVELVVACDVTTPFSDAAPGLRPAEGRHAHADRQLVATASVTSPPATAPRWASTSPRSRAPVPPAGSAGGLVVLGRSPAPGLRPRRGPRRPRARLDGADLVVTGEGHLDPPSFEGKVPGGVLDLARARAADARFRLCIVGGADPAPCARHRRGIEVVSLTERFGRARARRRRRR